MMMNLSSPISLLLSLILIFDGGVAAQQDQIDINHQRHIDEGQAFLVAVDGLAINERPGSTGLPTNNVAMFWLGPPSYNIDNETGQILSVVSQAIFFVDRADEWKENGLSIETLATAGYASVFDSTGNFFDIVLADFDDGTQRRLKDYGEIYLTGLGWETSPSSNGHGVVGAGNRYEWVDTDHPIAEDLAELLGTNLTTDSFEEAYQVAYDFHHTGDADEKDHPPSDGAVSASHVVASFCFIVAFVLNLLY